MTYAETMRVVLDDVLAKCENRHCGSACESLSGPSKLRCVTQQFLEIRTVEIGSEIRKVSGRKIIGHSSTLSENYHQVINKIISV